MGAKKLAGKVAVRGAVAGTPLVFRGVVWCWKALVVFGAWIVSKKWGRVTGAAVIVLMLLDAAWGSDGVGFPIIGWPLALVAMLVVGGVRMRRRRHLTDRIEDAVRSHVPGYYRGDDVRVRYGVPLVGNVTPLESFGVALPAAVTDEYTEQVETRMRSVLPAGEGSTWQFALDTNAGRMNAWLIRDLPRSIWHPYTDGSFGNPLHPVGDTDVVPLGVSYGDERLVWRMNEAPHALIVGATGGGKSVLINTVLEHFLLHRDSFELHLIDLKTTEFAEFAEYPGVARTVALSHEDALESLMLAHATMEERQGLLRSTRTKDLPALNAAAGRKGHAALPRVVVVMDEIGELLARTNDKERQAVRDEIEELMLSIGRLGRAMGVHLLTATQRSSKDLMPMELRLNTALRVGLGRLDSYQSAMILESEAGQSVSGGKGRGIVADQSRSGRDRVKHLQAYRIEMGNIREMIGVPSADSWRD